MASSSGKPSLISECSVAFLAILSLILSTGPSLLPLGKGSGYLHTCDAFWGRPRAPALNLLSL